MFAKRYCTGDTRRRTEALIEPDFSKVCPVLCAPVDIVKAGGAIGHLSPFANGMSFDDYMAAASGTYLDHLVAALALCRGIDVLERANFGHGDLHADNLLVEHTGGLLKVRLIDFDNFSKPALPPPPCLGQIRYLAPEIRRAVHAGRDARPDALSDRFALGVLLHELLLLRHPADHAMTDPAAFETAMIAGRWLGDPAAPERRPDDGGLPPELLSIKLRSLFRRALGCDRNARPAAVEWIDELREAVDAVYACHGCGRPFIVDFDKRRCPHCGAGFAGIRLVFACGKRFDVTDQPIVIGRQDLAAGNTVSRRHAMFYRRGPEIVIEPVGANPTYRLGEAGWEKLANGKPHALAAGMRLRLADREATVEEIPH
jgi:hypothetical protein